MSLTINHLKSEASKRWDFNENYARGFDKECSWQVWNNCDKKCLKTKRISARYLGIRVKHENVSDFTFTFPRIIVVRMMASSNENVFRVTGHLCGELTSPRWIPRKRPVTRSFDVFFFCVWKNASVNNREACVLRRYCAHYDVTVMVCLVHEAFINVVHLFITWRRCLQFARL